MKIVVLITVFEMAAVMAWMIYKFYSHNKQMILAMPANRVQPSVPYRKRDATNNRVKSNRHTSM